MDKIKLTQKEIAYALEHGYIDISKFDDIYEVHKNNPEENEWWTRNKRKQIRRYSRKQQHKNYLKQHFKRSIGFDCSLPRDDPYYIEYYRYNCRSYLSGIRRVCKLQTNKKMRQLKSDVVLLAPGDYRRLFDYWWMLY